MDSGIPASCIDMPPPVWCFATLDGFQSAGPDVVFKLTANADVVLASHACPAAALFGDYLHIRTCSPRSFLAACH